MGDLIRAPYSVITATVELLDRLGVTPHDLEVLRKDSSRIQTVVGRILKSDGFLWAMLGMEQAMEKVGFVTSDFWQLTKDEDLLAQLLSVIREQAEVRLLPLLKFITAVIVPASNEFIARDYFKVDMSDAAVVKIFCLRDNFKAWLLNKTEPARIELSLRCHKLCKDSTSRLIIAELGGEAMAETTIAEMYTMMERQKNGESGELLTNGSANIFYIRDIQEVLCAVRINWNGDGWDVDAESVADTNIWFTHNQIFSH